MFNSKTLLRLALAIAAISYTPTLARADNILDWNETLRLTMQANTTKANPGWSTRTMAVTNGSMYDIMMAFDKTHQQYQFHGTAPAGASMDAAMHQAAYHAILECYPDQQALLDAALATRMSAIPDGSAKTAGIAFGNQVASTYMNWRKNDGADVTMPYEVGTDMGDWQPDPYNPAQTAWGPEWGGVGMFAMPSSGMFTIAGPPEMHTQAYANSYNQVKSLGALNTPTRLDDSTDIGVFWGYDRKGMGPPPVLFSRNLSEIGTQQGNTEEENARMFAMASVALADASIAAWDAKFVHNFWRPVTAIHYGEMDGNPATQGDPDWKPLGAPGPDPNSSDDDFTPPFPGYPSGHATFGGAVYETLRQFYGTDDIAYTLSSEETVPHGAIIDGLTYRSFNDFSQAEFENAMSRIYLGVHWDFEALDGISLGNQIAQYVSANYFQAVPEPSSYAMLLPAAMAGLAVVRRRTRKSTTTN